MSKAPPPPEKHSDTLARGRARRRQVDASRRPGESRREAKVRLLEEERPAHIAALQQRLATITASMSADDLAVARAALSRFTGPCTSRRRDDDYRLGKTLRGIAAISAPAETIEGVEIPEIRPLPIDLAVHVPTSKWFLPTYGITHDQIVTAWEDAKDRGRAAALPSEMLAVLFPPELWPAIPQIIREGPEVLVRRVHLHARRLVADAHARGKTMTPKSVESTFTVAWRLIDRLIALNSLAYRYPGLDAWRARPPALRATDYSSDVSSQDRTAPPRELIRSVMRPWFLELAARTRDFTKVPYDSVGHLSVRTFVFVSILLTTGVRVDCLRELRVGDFEAAHRFPDGSVGPAIRIRPPKTRQHYPEPRWKALPPQLVPCIQIYMEMWRHNTQPAPAHFFPNERHQEGKTHPTGCWVDSNTAIGGERHLYVAAHERKCTNARQRAVREGLSPAEVEEAVAAVVTKSGASLFPRVNGRGPWDGHTQHTLRAYANQALVRACDHYLQTPEGRQRLGGTIDAYAAARAVIDQEPGTADILGYGAARKLESRELLSRLLVPLVWEFMVGDLGAPQGVDQEALARAQERHATLLQRQEDIEARLDAIESEALQARIRERKALVAGRRPRRASAEDAWTLAQEAQDRFLVALDEIELAATTKRRETRAQARAVDKAIRESEQAIRDIENTAVPQPERTPEDYVPPGMQVAVHAPSDKAGAEEEPAILVPVRDVLWPEEFAEVIGRSVGTINRWLDPDQVDGTDSEKSLPWSVADLRAGRVTLQRGPRKRLIQVGAINRGRLTSDQQAAIDVKLASELPKRTRAPRRAR